MIDKTSQARDAHYTSFRFCLNEVVVVVAHELPARIIGRCESLGRVQTYHVIYVANGHRHDEWLYEHELMEAQTDAHATN